MKNVNKTQTYTTKIILFNNGERFPILLDTTTGEPDYWCTLYSITQLRAKGRAVATIKQTIRNILLFKIIMKNLNINEKILEQRFKEGWIFHLYEIEGLTEQCKLFVEDILHNTASFSNHKHLSDSFENHRAKNSNKILQTIGANTAGNRIRDIRDFLDWWVNAYLAKIKINNPKYSKLVESKKFVIKNLTSRIPKESHNSSFGGREGLPINIQKILLEMIDHNSLTNPWKSKFTRARNELIILWLLQFGIRRGELLNLKISDINFQQETFYILRRADDPDDPRKDQPNVKTKGRKLEMPKVIADLTHHYIIDYRAKLPYSKKHEFLFVADKTGQPLSKIAVNKIFEQLKNANKDLPRDLSAHILRHTWNDNFSKHMDKKAIGEEREKQIRSYIMGWSPTSNTSSNYTKRHMREEANKAILDLCNDGNMRKIKK